MDKITEIFDRKAFVSKDGILTNPQIVLMCGLPRSGKSMFVDKYLRNMQLICPDDIRLAFGNIFNPNLENYVWTNVYTMTKAHMIRSSNIVIDATNTSYKRVIPFDNLAIDNKYKLIVCLVDTPLEVCLERNKLAGGVPEEVIYRMHESLEEFKTSAYFKNLDVKYYKGGDLTD